VINLYRSRAKLDKRGSELVGKCPLPGHKDDTASFTIRRFEGVWIWQCFGACQSSGNIMQFIQRMDNCNFKRACEIVEEFCGVADKERAEEVFDDPLPDEPAITYTLEQYKKLEDALEKNTFVQNWIKTERGIDMETARELHFGYRPTIRDCASPDKIENIIDKGWIVLPTIENGQVVAMEYRSIIQKEIRQMPDMKTGVLFGVDLIDPFEPVFVTEGKYDAAILRQAGFIAVSITGAGFSPKPETFEALNAAEYVVLAGDTDAPGILAMNRLETGLKRFYRITWPQGSKDANDAFIGLAKRNTGHFKELVDGLVAEAKNKKLPGVYSVQNSLMTAEHTKLIDHPSRFRFPWKSVDDMAIILPGTVTTVFSTDSGMGKSSWVFQSTIHGAREHGEVVLNYQAELTSHQIDTIFTSHLMRKDRLNLEEEDYRAAGRALGPDFRYYIGRDTSLTSIDQVLDLIESGIKHFRPTVVVLDNLHFLCRGTGRDTYKEQATAMQRITNMAATYNLKFIVVHQARKADQQHKGKTNHISDLDGTKAVQNDSATVFSIHRDEVKHNKDLTTNDNEYSPITQIAVKKFRDKGPGGSYTTLMFAGKVCTFSEIISDIKAPEITSQPEESIF